MILMLILISLLISPPPAHAAACDDAAGMVLAIAYQDIYQNLAPKVRGRWNNNLSKIPPSLSRAARQLRETSPVLKRHMIAFLAAAKKAGYSPMIAAGIWGAMCRGEDISRSDFSVCEPSPDHPDAWFLIVNRDMARFSGMFVDTNKCVQNQITGRPARAQNPFSGKSPF